MRARFGRLIHDVERDELPHEAHGEKERADESGKPQKSPIVQRLAQRADQLQSLLRALGDVRDILEHVNVQHAENGRDDKNPRAPAHDRE